jgi:lipid-A-disaccharide synthase
LGWRFNAKSWPISQALSKLAFMGLRSPKNLNDFRFYKICKNDIAEFKPDVIIFIDYPGFKCVLQNGQKRRIQTHYYISPQIWAWREIASLIQKN